MKKDEDRRQGFIEAFEDDQAVIYQSDRSFIRVARSSLPTEARRGHFVVELEETDHFAIDYDTTEKRVQELRSMSECFCN